MTAADREENFMIDDVLAGRLYDFFGGLLNFYRDFLSLETEKYGDISAGRLGAVNARIKKEQAFVMRAKGLELDRRKLLEEAGAEEATMRDLIPMLPAERQHAMQDLHAELSQTLNSLKRTNDSCQQMTKDKLRQISKTLSNLEDHPELKQIYGSTTEQESGTDGVFSIKI